MSDSVWPAHAQFLIPGVNDTWNNFQKSRKGVVSTSKDWKDARQALYSEFQRYLSAGGLPLRFDKDMQRCECIADKHRIHLIVFSPLQERNVPNMQPSD